MGRSRTRSKSNDRSRKDKSKKSKKNKYSRSPSNKKDRKRKYSKSPKRDRKEKDRKKDRKEKEKDRDRDADKHREKEKKEAKKTPPKKQLTAEELEKQKKQRRIKAILMKYEDDGDSDKEINKEFELAKQNQENGNQQNGGEENNNNNEGENYNQYKQRNVKQEEDGKKEKKQMVFVDSDGLEGSDDEPEYPIIVKREEFNKNVPQPFQSKLQQKNGNKNNNENNKNMEQEEEIDPLDAYLQEIEGGAPKQEEYDQYNPFDNEDADQDEIDKYVANKQIITLDQILNGQNDNKQNNMNGVVKKEKIEQENGMEEEEGSFDFSKEKEKYLKEEEDEDKYYEEFKKQLKKKREEEEKKVIYLEDSGDEKDEAYEEQVLFGGDNQDDYFKKKQKMEQKKDLKTVDHLSANYLKIRKNFYVEPKELKNMTEQEVAKYREELGDIQVKSNYIQNIPKPAQNWYQCGLTELQLQLLIKKKNYQKPFPIQCQCFPIITSGYDTIGVAETGSGKTLAYILPMLRHIQDQPPLREGDGPIGLVLVPTRELAQQIYGECKSFAKPLGLTTIAVYGGAGIQGQLSELKKGGEIVICTPARLIDVLTTSNGKITNLNRVSYVVIDEADRMLDQGFQPQIVKILNNVRLDRQTVMFSATFPKEVESLANILMDKPIEVVVGAKGQACTNIDQEIEVIDEVKKQLRLLEILGQWNERGSIIIFVEKRQDCDILFQELIKFGYLSISLHGDMDPDDREFAIYDFKKGVANILVATSLCARGLDHRNVVLVINYDCPNHLEDYIHRIGRTGRAGQKGNAITFITPEQDKYATDLIKALQMSSQKVPQDLVKLDKAFKQKVARGEAKIFQNKVRQGSGFKFTEEELGKQNKIRKELKKRFGAEQGISDSESEEDIFNKPSDKKNENGKLKDEQKTVKDKLKMIKDPIIKQQIQDKGSKATELAILNGASMEEIQQAAINAMLKAIDENKAALKSVEQGTQQAAELFNEFIQQEQKNQDIVSADFQINDYPLNARARVTGREFLGQIYDLTNCIVTVQGNYYEANKKVPAGHKKQYLHIEGDSKNAVSTAYQEIKRVIEEAANRNLSLGIK
ncbi:P-loop containing nucleoside triphosphate hydrolase [Pseudocohnilembus persalinus]|uniref:RNA helicase n=1 Tax=Pseudocohnilembus persalinus TaxID=266149 RepID=A0A0V0Q900_PSEPJ|nr:P-loop containing nucleoside triphosphate hydrolase [Pseudocohnilembus persalinus]|eukprot:KRW98717.1 P-loop containing nucleoside triphosphate hydrolase [Pseudocohnilembus persalinus]